jgi:hypothetical protein
MNKLQINERTEIVRDDNVIATEINVIKSQTDKILLSSAIEIGKRLKEAKQMVGHGNWENWLKTEVSYSQRTAQNLMRIYDEYGQNLLENEIRNSIADLGYTQAVAMLKLDFEERENFIAENDVPSLSVKDLEAAIKEKNDILREKEILEGRVKALIDNQTVLETEIKEHSIEIGQYESEIENYKGKIEEMQGKISEVDNLQKQLDESKATDSVDPELVKTLEDKLNQANLEAEALKKQVAEKSELIASYKPIEIEKTIEVIKEVESESALAEIKTLKAKIAASENTIKYKAMFQVVTDLFDEMINVLNAMKASDAGEYEKYKGATNKLLEQLKQ